MKELNNIKQVFKNKTPRNIMLVTFAILGGAIIYGRQSQQAEIQRPKELAAAVGVINAPTSMTDQAAGTSTSQVHNQLLGDYNEQKTNAALSGNESSTPVLTNTTTASVDPLDKVQQVETTPVEMTPPSENQPIMENKVESNQPYQKSNELLQAEKELAKKIEGLMVNWAPSENQGVQEFSYAGKQKQPQANGQGQNVQNGESFQAESLRAANQGQATGPADIKAGAIANAIILTAINSDEPGPILAQIVTGPYSGTRLLGKFEKPQNSDTLVLSFSSFTNPRSNRSESIEAYAVDPTSARTALADDVDHHYLYRYGSLLGAAFVKGWSQAVGQSGSTQVVTVNNGGVSSSTTYPELNNQKIAQVALGEVGTELAGAVRDNVKRPVTVKINSGTPMGILFMKDVFFKKD